MVKNTTGGNRHKGLARKEVNAARGKTTLRSIEEEGEMFAVVVKVLGGSRAAVIGMDNKERDCVIRGKFRGKKKRDNTLRPGVLVLIGDRDWTSSTDSKKIVCDLLEVYSDSDKERLKNKEVSIDWKFLAGVGEIGSHTADLEGLVFTDNTNAHQYSKMIEEEIGKGGGKAIELDFGHDEEIDIDDI